MPENYIQIMIQSLAKKEQVLDEVLRLSKNQAVWMGNPELTPDEFEKNISEKAEWIEKLEQLDDGFEMLYERVAEQLKSEKEKYANEIHTMQDYIRRITEKSMEIQTVEARNKAQVEEKFSSLRKQIRQIKDSQRMVKEYYRSMQKVNYIDPQFMDNKK